MNMAERKRQSTLLAHFSHASKKACKDDEISLLSELDSDLSELESSVENDNLSEGGSEDDSIEYALAAGTGSNINTATTVTVSTHV